MASTTASRFAFLTDDAADPFEKKKKKAAGAGDAKKTTAKSKNTNNSNSNAKSGSQQQGQGKKKKVASNNNTGEATVNSSKKFVFDPESHDQYPELKSDQFPPGNLFAVPVGINPPEINGSGDNQDSLNPENAASVSKKKSKKGKKVVPEKPKDEQWQQWQKRDQEFVTGSFESDLEAALMQSKIEAPKDDPSNAGAKPRKAKSKPMPVSLTEFHKMIGTGGSSQPGLVEPNWSSLNGFSSMMPPPGLHPLPHLNEDVDAAMMEQFRLETQQEMERERRLEIERAILKSRAPVPVLPGKGTKNPVLSFNSTKQHQQNVIPCSNPDHITQVSALLDQDKKIGQLSNEKVELEKELGDLRIKFRKICVMLADAQLKDKAVLLRDVDKLTQLNTDLNEQVTLLHSQLEQEKSKCSTLATELRKALEQTRKRTQSHSENQ